MNYRYIKALVTLPLLLLTACNGWLDVMPDNRSELDSPEKVRKLLVSAYPSTHHILCTEFSSDNVDDFGEMNPNLSRVIEDIYTWDTVLETDNEDPTNLWSAHYDAINNANQALEAIEALGNPDELKPSRGEALLCRAYNHFILANVFCKAYNPETADTDLGIPYMTAPEKELYPKYSRGTVADVYEKIGKDLEEGLPLIDDAAYVIPKYHFNKNAAYTFASRYYLYTGDWDNVIKCANMVLGSAPVEMMRDYKALADLPQNEEVLTVQYNSSDAKNNFLIQTGYSTLGVYIGPYTTGKRHGHGQVIMTTEILNRAPWGSKPATMGNYEYVKMYKYMPFVYAATNMDFIMFPKIPYLFEYVDPVSGIGYNRTNIAILTAEEALLNRAEAYLMKDDYTNALADMNIWARNTLDAENCDVPLTSAMIEEWAEDLDYYEPQDPTPKKHLNPLLFTLTEDTKFEAFLQAIIYIRRVEFLHTGLRWFDVKRFGIEIYRRLMSAEMIEPETYTDVLTLDDERRALQLPHDVIVAGMAANPR